jgi:sugar lactone lactonase YvrE
LKKLLEVSAFSLCMAASLACAQTPCVNDTVTQGVSSQRVHDSSLARGHGPAINTSPALLANGYIETFAGNGIAGFSGDGGPATAAEFSYPSGITFDAAGNLYIADAYNGRIRKVAATTGIVTTVAGNGTALSSGDGGPAINAGISSPYQVVSDPAGNLYITDSNNLIRRVDATTGIITTYAGNGQAGYSGDGGLATNAELVEPLGLALDAAGDLYFVDGENQRIRKIDAATGIISLVAGDGDRGYDGDGGPATSAELCQPTGVALDGDGNVYITDAVNSRIRKVDASTGIITTFAGDGVEGNSGDGGPATNAEVYWPYGVILDSNGNLYFSDIVASRVRVVDASTGIISTIAGNGISDYGGDGGPSLDAEFISPWGIAFDGAGNLYIADPPNSRIRIVYPLIATITALTASANSLTVGQSLTLTATVTAASGATPTGTVTFYNGTTSLGMGTLNGGGVATLTLTPAIGNYSISASYGGSTTDGASVSSPVISVTVSGIPTTSALSANPLTLPAGQLLTLTATVEASSGSTPTGTVTFLDGTAPVGNSVLNSSGVATLARTPAAGSYSFTASYAGSGSDGPSVSTAVQVNVTGLTTNSPNIYTFAGDGITGAGGDGGLATAGELNAPWYTSLDAAGNLYIADTDNDRIQKVDGATGIITTVAGTGVAGYNGDGELATSAQIAYPYGVVSDAAGDLYISDGGNVRIRRVDAATGIISTVAGNGNSGFSGDGGPATDAEIDGNVGLTLDAFGDIYFADVADYRVRRVDGETGIITTVAGTGTKGFNGDGGPATKAELSDPFTVLLDAAGNLLIADEGNSRIRKVSASTGNITTIAGNGSQGDSGDGGPATSAEFGSPFGIALDASGNLYISDLGPSRVRRVDAATGIIEPYAGNGTVGFSGDGGPANLAELNTPTGLSADPKGNLYITDTVNRRIRIVGQQPQLLIATTTVLTASSNALTLGQSLTLTATVTAVSGATPTGTVTFLNGATSLGTGTLNAGGVATLTLTPALGTYSITANYGGSSTDAGSVSAPPIAVIVGIAATTTTLVATPTSLTYGQSLTLTATVTAASGSTPTSTVTFFNGTASLGSSPLNAGGQATLTLNPAVGVYSITASYGGSASDAASVSSPPILVTVTAAATTTSLTSSLNPAPFGAAVTFTATVSDDLHLPTNPGGLPPMGTVSFYDGTSLLGTETLASGVGTYSTSVLSVGSHNITAVYASTTNFNPSTSTVLDEVINSATFSISGAPGSQTLYTGETASYTVTVTPGAGFNLPVALSCSQLAANTTCNFSPATVNGGSWNSMLTVQTTAPGPNPETTPLRKMGAIAAASLLLFFIPVRIRRSRKGWPVILMALALVGAVISGCSGPGTLTGGTPLGAQTVTISGSATNGAQTLTETTTVTLNVQSLF